MDSQDLTGQSLWLRNKLTDELDSLSKVIDYYYLIAGPAVIYFSLLLIEKLDYKQFNEVLLLSWISLFVSSSLIFSYLIYKAKRITYQINSLNAKLKEDDDNSKKFFKKGVLVKNYAHYFFMFGFMTQVLYLLANL